MLLRVLHELALAERGQVALPHSTLKREALVVAVANPLIPLGACVQKTTSYAVQGFLPCVPARRPLGEARLEVSVHVLPIDGVVEVPRVQRMSAAFQGVAVRLRDQVAHGNTAALIRHGFCNQTKSSQLE